MPRKRLTPYLSLPLVAGFLAGHAHPLAAQEPPRLDGFLSPAVREAFDAAAHHDDLWKLATRDGESYLRERGVEIPRDLSVSFLNVQRQGDWTIWADGQFAPLFEMYCPPVRTWWQECGKIMRVCESRTIAICKDTNTPDLKDPCYPKETSLETVDLDCYSVCERSIWEKEFTLPTRPPFPPVLAFPPRP